MDFENDKKLFRERIECVKDICYFLNKDIVEIETNISNGLILVKDEWENKNPKTDEEILKFYKETENYLYDLTSWHFNKRRKFDVELVNHINNLSIENNKIFKILDFGCGIGQNAFMLANAGFDVTIADLDSVTLNFAEFRFKRHEIPYKIWKTDIEKEAPEEKYDIILGFDVFEHLTESQTESVIERLLKLKHKDTMVFLNISFGSQGGAHPMHFESSDIRKSLINKLVN